MRGLLLLLVLLALAAGLGLRLHDAGKGPDAAPLSGDLLDAPSDGPALRTTGQAATAQPRAGTEPDSFHEGLGPDPRTGLYLQESAFVDLLGDK